VHSPLQHEWGPTARRAPICLLTPLRRGGLDRSLDVRLSCVAFRKPRALGASAGLLHCSGALPRFHRAGP